MLARYDSKFYTCIFRIDSAFASGYISMQAEKNKLSCYKQISEEDKVLDNNGQLGHFDRFIR